LINGRPLAAEVVAKETQIENTDHDFEVLTLRNQSILNMLDHVRVIGVVTTDTGPEGHGDKNPAPEIHPVYSVDIITATGRENLSGVWADDFGGTYYLAQTGLTVWGFGKSPLRDDEFGLVFKATFGGMTEIVGSWEDVPLGRRSSGGALVLYVDPGRMQLTNRSTLPVPRLIKLYDSAAGPFPSIHIETTVTKPGPGGTGRLGLSVSTTGFPDAAHLGYQWAIVGAQPIGRTDRQSIWVTMPSSGTVRVAVKVMDSDGGALTSGRLIR
jgi:hypothetical protein